MSLNQLMGVSVICLLDDPAQYELYKENVRNLRIEENFKKEFIVIGEQDDVGLMSVGGNPLIHCFQKESMDIEVNEKRLFEQGQYFIKLFLDQYTEVDPLRFFKDKKLLESNIDLQFTDQSGQITCNQYYANEQVYDGKTAEEVEKRMKIIEEQNKIDRAFYMVDKSFNPVVEPESLTVIEEEEEISVKE